MRQQARRQARMRNSWVVVTRIGLTVLLHLTAALVLSSLSMGRPQAPRRRLDPALASEFLPLSQTWSCSQSLLQGFAFRSWEACSISGTWSRSNCGVVVGVVFFSPPNMNLSACVGVLLMLTTVSGLRTPAACQASWPSSTPLWIFSDFWVVAHSVLPPLFYRHWPTPGLTRMELCCDRALLRSSTLTILPHSLTLHSKYEKVSMPLCTRSLQLQFKPSASRTPTVATFSERRELPLFLTRQKLVQILAHCVPWRNASKGSHLFLRMRIWSIVASQLLNSRNFLP